MTAMGTLMEVPEVEDVAEIASTHLDVLYAKITTNKWNSKFIAAKKKKKSSNHTNYHPPWHFFGTKYTIP